MFTDLTVEEKLRLLRFVCAFAWSDLEIQDQERTIVVKLIDKLDLPKDDREEAMGWLDHPPSEDELDPYDVPEAHRKLFVDAALEMVGVDGVVDRLEAEQYAIFEALMGLGEDPFLEAEAE